MHARVNYVAILSVTLASLAPGLMRRVDAALAADQPQVIRRTLEWPSTTATARLELSNITGAVTIVGEDRRDAIVVATRTVTHQGAAGDEGATPDFRSSGEGLLVCGDSRRCGCHLESRSGDRRDDEDRTRVRTEFEVHVPRAVSLDVCTVNGGTLRVSGTQGSFRVAAVNGDVEASNITGSGRMTTVNGNVTVAFTAAPQDGSSFQTVNGSVVVKLPSSVSADLRLATLHGGIYTDFDTVPVPDRATSERHGGRVVYRSTRSMSVRIGSGGPELQLKTVNGDIQVRKN